MVEAETTGGDHRTGDPEDTRDRRPTRTAPRAVTSLDRGERRRRVARTTARLVVGSVLLVVTFYALPLDWDVTAHLWAVVAGSVALAAGVVLWPVRAVAHADLPELRAIETTGFAAVLSVVLFASIYVVLSHSDAGAFSESLSHTDALYLSLTTLTTVGFGDVSASSEAARVAVMIQMLATFAVLGVVVRLVSRVVKRALAAPQDVERG